VLVPVVSSLSSINVAVEFTERDSPATRREIRSSAEVLHRGRAYCM
jgi:hypothetical protein